jgi:ATP-binding cassette, subfamily B, bacterial
MDINPERTRMRDKQFKQKRALWPFLRRIFIYSYRYRAWFWQLIGFAVLVAIIEALLPLVWYRFIDDFVTPAVDSLRSGTATESPSFTLLRDFGLIYLVLIIVQTLGSVWFTWCAGRIREHVIFDLRTAMFDKLQKLPYAFYDRSATGWLTIRLTSDADRVSEIISFGFISLVSGLMMIIASFAAMFAYSWQLAAIILATMPLMALISVRIRQLILQYSRQSRRLYSEMAASLTEHINGIEINKALVQESRAAESFRSLTDSLRHSSYRAALYSATYNPVVIVAGSLAVAVVIYLGGHQVLASHSALTVGLLAAFFGYARMIYEPILEITRFYSSAQDSLSAGERIFSLIDEPVTIADQPGARPVPAITGDVHFENVHFHYEPGKPVIRNLNLHLRAGESVALVGPTGEGKSTIINLLCRFYEPTEGVIRVDGQDYRTLSLQSYRQHLGVILQTAYLFSGTMRENIRYGRRSASDAEVEDALRAIGAEEYLGRLDERVGEEGDKLSSGEKQIIAFARVILKDPALLIMDEATSSLDTLAEHKIQQCMHRVLARRTSVIIAHRLSTIRHCDRILYIRQGGIAEEGSHEELLRKRGYYYQLYTQQMEESFV